MWTHRRESKLLGNNLIQLFWSEFRVETADRSVLANQELGEVPLDILSIGGTLEVGVDGVSIWSVHFNLLSEVERNTVVHLAEFNNLSFATWFLSTKLVAWETNAYETLVRILLVQVLKTRVLLGETTLGRNVDQENNLSLKSREVDSSLSVDSFNLEVVDGHCCEDASVWFSEHLPQKILELPNFEANSIKNACLEADNEYKAYVKQSGSPPGGTTAVFAILQEIQNPKNSQKQFKMIVGNIGDSRCLLIKDGKLLEQITRDHKPTNPDEKKKRELLLLEGM